MSCRAVSGGSRRSAIFAVGCILAALLAFLSAASARAAAFTAATVGDFGNVTVMTVSGNYDADLADGEPNVEPRQIIAREFFRTHRDDYDFLVIFTSFPFQMPAGEAAAFYAGVRNDTQGLGLPLFDYSADYGSAARLQGTIDMGELASHVADPLNPRFDETLGLLNHELLHRWGAHLKFRTAGGSVSDALLGRDGDHWSYLLDTRGSVLYGSRWRDNGDGTFTALEARTYFSPLDLYVMGMIGKEQVPPMLLIENPSLDPTRLPEVGATISGTARTVTIDEIIAAVGERLPRPDQAQKRFKVAFIYAAAPGSFSGSELPALENIRNGFLTRYSILTDGQGLVQVAATPKVDLPTNPGTPGPTVVPRTAPADLAQGAAWLAAMQEHDGSWLDAGATRERDTAEAAAALRLFPETQAEAEEGLGWLASHDAANTDYLARRIETLADAGRDCAALVAELVARRNADGGWGAAAGFASTAGDTALALKALVCAGSTPSAAIADGVGYLNTHRNADGGWGGEGGASQVQPTADALLAFNALRTGYPVEAGLNTAAAWLLGKQNPDGGFGNSPSTVYDTAAAVLALHELGAPGAIVGRGANYLLERQAQDGSWEGSPYQTAVAVRAAWQAVEAPDVAVTADGISFIPEQVTVLPTQTVLQAAIRNLGRIDAPAVSVVLYEGGAAGGARLGEQVVACPGRSETVVTFAVPVTEGRERLLTVAVDPDGVIEESNEGNNQASKALRPAASVDFALAPDRVTLSASAVEQFQTVAIRATVANRGTQDAFDVPVRFFIDLAGALVEIATLAADLPAGGEATVETSWLATLSGAALPVTIVADPFGAFAELDEGNNRASQALTVTAVSRPNLAVASPGVTVSPDPVPFGDAVTIAATVVNSGGAPATNVRVDFYHGVPGHGGALLVCQTVPLLGAGQSLPLTAVWSDIQEAGGQIAFVVIDPLNAIVEGSEADNEAFASFAVRSLPDLALTADAIAVMPAAAREGETVTVQATVRNLGDQVAEQVRVRLSEAEVILQEQIVPQIEGQALASIAFSYDTTGRAGAHTVLVEVDPEGVIVEQRKENNRAEKTFGVQNANFWLSEQYISPNGDGVQDDTRLFFRLETPQTVRVAVVNEDGETVRTFSGAELENVDVAEVVWDGLDDLGRVVDDGEYRLRVQASAGGALGELAVMVDNNRSPFAKAIGTPFLRQLEVPEYVGEFAGWHRDESYYLVQGTFGNEPYGLFRLAAVDGARERLNPEEWYAQYRSDKWLDVQLAPAGDRLAVINLGQLWVTDAFTPFQTATSVLLGSANSPRWSPDGAKLAFQARVSSARWGLFVVSADGTGGMRLDDDSNSLQWSMNWWDDAFISYKWAPDASRIVYETPDGQLWLADLSGAKTKIFDGPVYSWQWLDRNRLVAVRYDNDNCYLIDAEAGYSELLAERVSSYFVSPSGQYLLAFDYYSKIKAYDLDGKRTVLDEYFDNIYSADIYYDCDKRNLWSGDSKKFHLLELYGADGPGLWVVDLETPLLRWLPIVGVTSDQVMDQYSRVEVVSYWMPDSRTIAVPVRKPTNAYGEWTQILIDVETGAGRETPLTTRYYDQMGFSPQGNYLFFNDRYQWYRPLSIFGAYLNLRADLVAVPQAAQVLLKGAAVDLHFSGWQLEYADVGSPDAWTLIQPFSETPVINDTLASWVPPHEGTYNIRLTAWDKAGNRKQVVKRVTWGERSPIANLYRTQSVFSPNGDGIKDTVEFKFTVTEPVQLEFLLYDANHRLVRRFTRSHPLTGEQALAWDGTDEQGQRVGDGLYRLKALDYELLVEVDTTPPDLALAAAFAAEGINAGLTGHADDKNLATWQIVYRPAGGSGDWTSLRQGTDALGRKPASPLATLATDNVTIAGLDATKLTLYGGKVFRLSAEDRAGNRASVLAGPLEERLAIYAWDQKWLDTNVLPAAWTRPEQHLIEAFETIGAPLAQVALEYRIGTAWQEAATGFDVSEAGIAVSWDTASAGAAPNAIRLKLVDVTGAVLYSNTLTTQNLFEIGVDCGSTPAGSNYLFEEVSRLSFRVQRETNGPWVEYASTGGGAAGTVPVGAFLMPPPDGGGEVRLKAAAETRTGRSYESNTIIWPPRCAGVSVTLGSPLPAAGCGAASGSRTLNADVTLAGGAAVTPQQLNLYRQTGAGWEVLKSFGAALQGSATVDTSAYPEGAQEFRLAFRYLDENGRGQERSAQLTLAVDRTLPVAEISYPSAAGQLLCPLKIAAPTGDRLAIPVQGLISDETDVQQYQLFYAAGENPGNWLPARTWVASQPGEIKGAGPLAGDLGLWDITGLPAGRYALKLQVGDAAGNGACHTVALDLRPPAQVARLALSEKIFSPNGDGSKDAVTIDYLLTEAASLKVEVYSLAKQGDSSQALSGSPVKIITSGLLQPAGAGAMQWDGTGEGGHPVADGKYVVVATATDVCGVDFRKTAFVEVDGAAPQVVLSAPAAGQSVGSIVEARGSAQDPHFSGYQLEAGEGAAPESWTTLAAGSHPVVNGLFGVWNNFGLEGLWTLRLSADDEAGNRATATVPLDLGERVALLKDFSVAPAVFSPNGDGRSDTVLVAYELNAPGEVLLEFVNEAGQVAATVSRSAPAAGTYSSVWDGKAADGALLADGDYQVRLTATAAANPAVRQEESLSLALDNTPPVVEIPNPQDQAYLSATTLAVSGRIEDRRLVDYALKLAGPQGELLLDAGRQNRAGHTFAVLESLPEGAYTFSATATDAAGNVTQLPRSFVIDRTPPVLSFSAPAAGAFFTAEDAAILLSGTVLEPNLSRYSLQVGSGQAPLHWQELTAGEALPGGSISHRWPFAGQNLPDGLYTLRLQARDKAGLEATVSNTLAIDSQPPQVGLTAPPSGGYVTAPFDVAGAASDANLTTFRLAISEGDCATAAKWALLREGNEPVAAGVLYSMPALPRDGAYCLRLSASDRPGHEAQALSGFTIDTRPPAAPQLSGRVENRTGARLEWTAGGEPDLAGFRLYRDGQPLEQALPPQLTLLDAGLAEGTHVYQAQAVDFAGNASALSEAVALIIDTTPPTVQLTSPAAGARLGGVVEIRGSAYSADDFREYRLYVGAGAEPARQLLRRSPVPTLNGTLAQWDASGLGEGAFTLRLEGEDLRGNLAVHEIVVTIDNVPPPAPHLHDVVVSGNRVDLTWEGGAADDLAGYLVYRNGRLANAGGLATASVKPWLVASLAYADANVPDGTHDYTVVAVDTAGNQSVPSNIRTVQIETRAPAVQIVAPADNSKFEFQTLVKAASPDEDVASVRFQYKRLETGDWTDLPPAGFSDPYRTYLDPAALGLSYGSVQLRATATDRAGNTGPHSPVVNLSHTDLTPPAPPAVLTARVDGDRVLLQWPGNGEADVAGYHVYRSGGESPIRLNDLLLPSPGFADAGLVDNLYAYAVTAVDQFGNESAASAAAVARVYAPVLLQPDKEIGQPTAAIDGYGVEPEAQVELFREPAAGTVSVGTVVADAAGRFRLTEILLVDGENRLTARATDALGNVSKASNVAGAVYSLPPQAPAGLAGASSGYAVSLHWQPSPEGDVIGYLLARDGELLNGLTAVGGATVTASSWEFNWYGSYQPGNAIDSQPYTYWLSARTPTEDEPEWIEVDLGRTELVSRLEIDWYDQWNAPKHFAVEVWDGYGWRGVAEVADNSEALCVATLPPGLRTGKVRVKVFAAYSESSHALVAEIRLLQRALIPTAVHSDQNLTDHLYRYAVSAVDYFGLESLRSEEMAVAVGDVVPPAAPQGLTSTVSGSAVQLDWSQTPNGEADLAGYNVYRRTAFGWTRINAGPVATTIFADENLPNGAYAYRITAIDQVGNESQPSPEAAAEVSITPLAAPTGLAVSAPAEGGSLRLQWQPGDDGAAGHTVFRATVSGGPYVRINDTPATETFFLDAGLANGTRYYYVVAAVDALGNESACSAEASATPYDSVPPSAPVFTAPVRGGENLITVAGAVDVAGSAEPGSLVEVFRNGLLAGSTTATERMVVSETIPWEYTAKRYFASPQGNYLAALGSNKNGMVLCISEVAIRGEECYPTPGYIGEIKWSPNERYVLFGYYESNSWMRRLAVLNRQAGVLEPFTEGEFSETDPSWTTDGRVAFVREQGQSRELWLKDMVSGELQRLADSMPGDYPVISPDGSKVAFIDYQSKELIVLDVESGETSYIICHNYSNFNILFWSGDSNKLAFVASLNESETEGNQIFVVDLEPLTIKPVTTAAGYIYQLAWSPEGDRLAFYRQTYDESVRSWRGSISLADLSANETLAVNDAHAMHLAWSDPETIVVFNGTGYFKINSGGFFNVENIALNSGNNVLYAIAIDASGNQSDPSASVTIRREAASLPDPAIAVADLRLYPPFPLPGEKVMITATVRNVGEAPADGVEAAISLWEAGGAISELARTTLPTLPPGGAEVVSSSATAPERFGRNTIFAVVDPAGKIGEASEENNRAEKEFIVTDKEEVGLSVRLSTGELASNQSLRLDVELGNSGPSRSLALDVRIEDAGGVPVAVLNASTFDINFGFQTLTFVWNSGSTVAGAYRARCVLRDGAAVVTEALKEFVILPDLAVQAALGTDKAAYGPMEQVQMTARVANAGVNSILDELKVDISILGPDRSLVYRKESLVRNLLPGMEAAVQMPWPVGLTPPGDHEVRLVATAHGRTVAQQTAAFRILARPIISGTLDVGSEVVPVGAPISVGFQVVNSGNAAASGMLRAVLSDAATGAVVAGQERGLDLPAGGSSSGRFEFAGDGLGLTSYRINLLHLGGEPQPLASGLFRVVDLAPPAVVILQPQSGEAAGGAVSLVVQASDEASGIAVVEYRIDGGQWRPLPAADPAAGRYAAQWEPTAADGGERLLSVRAADAAGNVSSPVSVTVVVQMDDRPPVTSIEIGQPMVAGEDVVYVSAGTSLALAATDDSSGVAASEYRFDEGAWQSYVAPFTAAGLPDGLHRVGFRSRDLAGNVEVEQTVTVAADSTPPTTAVGFKHQSWLDGTTVFVSAQTEALLSASDSLSGVQTTYCRFDDETSWRICNGPLALADLASGIHTLHYLSVDNVDNTEQEQSVTMTLIGVEVETAFANLPRVLVWTEDPQHLGGKDHPPYTLEDIGALAAEALAGPDRYFTLVTGKDEFWQAFRSGVHNTVMVIRQDVPLDAGALREMREAVHGGMGLLVSLWGNSVPPVWQEVFGIDFKGSLGTSAQQRPLVLFESPVSAGQTLTASGKVLKVDLAGGALAGVIPGESRCSGVHDLALRYPVAVLPGDRITVALSAPQGNKLIPVDEEQTIVGALPGGPVNASLGNTAGDLAIADISADGVTLGIAAPFGYLEASYSLALTLERADGSRLGTGPVMVAPACASHLSPGMSVGPFIVVQAGEDRVRVSDDLPAAVLYRYGRGKAVFLAYDVVASALHAGRDGHLELLRRASTWLRPDVVGPEAGGVAMLETRVRLQGASLPIRTADTLDQRLNHLPLFDLMQHPLESAFHLADGEEAAWRYFLRIPDEAGDYGKTTEVFLGLEEGEALFGATPWRFTVVRDSRALMLAAMQWLDLQLQLHPEATEALTSLRAALAEVANLPRTTAAEAEQVIHALVQALHQAGQLGFDASELREVLDDYLRIVAGEFP